jgi:hypothetical protein
MVEAGTGANWPRRPTRAGTPTAIINSHFGNIMKVVPIEAAQPHDFVIASNGHRAFAPLRYAGATRRSRAPRTAT